LLKSLYICLSENSLKMKNVVKSSFVLLLAAIGLASCYREPVFSTTPEIEFKDIKKIVVTDNFSGAKKDSIVISLAFKDGDGDMGLDNKQIESTYKGKYNYIVKAFRRSKGVYVDAIFDPSLSGFFPRLKLNDKLGPIEGTLDYSIDFLQPFTKKNDTLKFEISLKDRAGNQSKPVETKPIVLHTLI
jgi:hypothetical protein